MTDTQGDREAMMNRLQTLKAEHRELDTRIAALVAKPYLSPEEQLEVAHLKKLKLHKKDEIFAMASRLGVEI